MASCLLSGWPKSCNMLFFKEITTFELCSAHAVSLYAARRNLLEVQSCSAIYTGPIERLRSHSQAHKQQLWRQFSFPNPIRYIGAISVTHIDNSSIHCRGDLLWEHRPRLNYQRIIRTRMSELTHLDEKGRAHMVDVTDKLVTSREATAEAVISMLPDTLSMILEGKHKKGDVFAVARIAGIQAAKQTSTLIPLCHPLMLTSVKVELEPDRERSEIRVIAICRLAGQTGVEMEALTAASVAALTLYDMCKAVDKGMVIRQVRLLEKKGGKSGSWSAEVATHG